MTGPLEGIRIIELGQMIAVPAATQLLASYGAEIIKIENTGTGDELRFYSSNKGGISAMFAHANAGKRSIALDLKEEAGKKILWQLLETSDALIEGFRPGVLAKLGFGFDVVSSKCPSLVYCSSTGFGPTGPYRDLPVYDPLIQALSGWAGAQQVGDDPTLVRGFVADKVAATGNAQAVTAALVKSSRTGEGSHIQLGMLESNIAFNWTDVMMHCCLLDDDATHQSNILSSYRLFRAKDGWVSLAVSTDKQAKNFCEALDRQDVIDSGRFATAAQRGADIAGWFNTLQESIENSLLADLLDLLIKADVPVAPVLSPADVASNPQVAAAGFLEEKVHPLAGKIRGPRSAASSFGDQLTLCPAPSHGQDGRQLLDEMAYSPGEIDELAEKGIVLLRSPS
ncbi:MAG: hypothetical protein CMQ20_01910 [Gammaproteobacteria bacterium]|jgi:crotonobetainyl-CoA:carnitine CoA-transferase CaiB-like acyl-CoA transferase|nr:hypothetical protein [Gammaproteobacteria bacterium]|tara:strand:+ start:3329 stop:4519 length:1191 start_codon:yes stop_codon:yes gene_type:complete